jgi:hypothetical protein
MVGHLATLFGMPAYFAEMRPVTMLAEEQLEVECLARLIAKHKVEMVSVVCQAIAFSQYALEPFLFEVVYLVTALAERPSEAVYAVMGLGTRQPAVYLASPLAGCKVGSESLPFYFYFTLLSYKSFLLYFQYLLPVMCRSMG